VTSVGLVLSGGGARAAYQVGALRALSEIIDCEALPFRVIAGLSAGAINAAALAAGAADFREAALKLTRTWLSLTPERVYRTDARALASVGVQWMKDVTTGGVLGAVRSNHLLDTAPLRELLTDEIDVHQIEAHLLSGNLRGVALSTTCYRTGSTVTFFDGVPGIELWERRNRISCRGRLEIDHVMASAAIPVFFPPVKIGGRFYGDGGMRMTAPIGPAIHLGAEKILTIGIRYPRLPVPVPAPDREPEADTITLSAIAGVLLNALFLDSLDNDIERLERINRTLSVIPEQERHRLRDPLRRLPILSLKPSRDLGALAAHQYERFPAMLRHLLRGIGASRASGWDLISYLAFDPTYVGQLMELGYADTQARRGEVEAFFRTPVEDEAPPSLRPLTRPS
jgi:NTE family protein